MKKLVLPETILSALALAAFLFTGTGCSSPGEPRDLMAEEARSEHAERPVAMKGEATFADGKINVVATVARGFARIGKGPAPKGQKGNRWFKKDTDAYSEDENFRAGGSEEEQKEMYKSWVRQAMARRAAGSPMPPVTLRVEFENRSNEAIEIEPTDVNSDLGNFAVRPKKLTIAAGETGVLDPMVSQLGVTNDVIPVTISIRMGAKKETHVIPVKTIFSPAVIKAAESGSQSPSK